MLLRLKQNSRLKIIRPFISGTIISFLFIVPFAYSSDLYNGLVTAKQLLFYGIMSLLAIYSRIRFLFSKKKSFRLNLVDLAILFFYAYLTVRAITTPYTSWLHNTKYISYSLLVLLYFITRQFLSGDEKEITIRIIVTALLLSGFFQAITGLQQLYGLKQSFHSGFKITGTFFNPAPYALYLAAIFPVALGNYLFSGYTDQQALNFVKRSASGLYEWIKHPLHNGTSSTWSNDDLKIASDLFTRYLSLLTFLVILLVLPATMNRASWLGAGIIGLIVLSIKYGVFTKLRFWLVNKTRIILLTLVLLILAGFFVAGLYYLKKGSSIGRQLIWEVTLRKITDKPFFGHGIGRFEAEYNNWQGDYFRTHPGEMDGSKGMAAGNTKYCFNEYLELASETGVIGLMIFTGILITALLKKSTGRRAQSSEQKNHCAPLEICALRSQSYALSPLPFVTAIISILICALVSIPFYTLPVHILFFMFLAIISSDSVSGSLTQEKKMGYAPGKIIRTIGFLIMTSIALLLIKGAYRQYKDYYTLDEAVMLYQTGNYREACDEFSQISEAFRYNGIFWQYYAKSLSMNKEYQESIRLYGQAQKYTSDEYLYTSLGDNYRELKDYPKAEEAYLHASLLAPHKLYPLYLLTKLYEEVGDKQKAYRTAEKILNKKVKVESEATKEILKEMRKLLKKIESPISQLQETKINK